MRRRGGLEAERSRQGWSRLEGQQLSPMIELYGWRGRLSRHRADRSSVRELFMEIVMY